MFLIFLLFVNAIVAANPLSIDDVRKATSRFKNIELEVRDISV